MACKKCEDINCLGSVLLIEQELAMIEEIKQGLRETYGDVEFTLKDSPSSGEIFTKFYDLHVSKGEVKSMKCPFCKADLQPSTSTARRIIGGKKTFFTNVPAWICPDEVTCGQVIFDSADIERIDQVQGKIKTGAIGWKTIFDYPEVLQNQTN